MTDQTAAPAPDDCEAEDELTTEELAKVTGGGSRSTPASGTGPHTSADVQADPQQPDPRRNL